MGSRDRSETREVRGRHDSTHTQRERERSSLGFSPIVPLGGRVAETATRRCSIEAASGAPMGRWFRARGGEIGAGVDAVDNGGALIAPFIGA
jgi:hypothetical protein